MLLSKARILIVDDEPSLRDIFGHWLINAGCGELMTAADGEKALAMIMEHPIDALVTDLRMPVMDGVTLVRRLVAVEHPIPSIIFVSGFGDIDAREMYSLGVETFLPKPVRREDLISAVEKTLADRSGLWLTPLPVAPRQSIVVEAAGLGEKTGPTTICLGSGGFSVHCSEWLSLGKVEFHCTLTTEKACVQGQGIVRWRSRNDQTLGIEFTYLQEPGRSWVIEQISLKHPRSFIPGL